MKSLCNLLLLVVVTTLVFYAGCGKSPNTDSDVPLFPLRFALPDAEKQKRFEEMWDKGRKTEAVLDRKSLGNDFPFRDDVSFAWAGIGPMDSVILARDDKVCAEVAWDNISYFLKRVETAKQLEVLIGVLHAKYLPPGTSRLSAQEVLKVIKEIDENGRGLPLKVVRRDIDHDSFDAKCIEKNSSWFLDFAIIEDLSLVEYKYIVDPQNRVARARRVIVEGPDNSHYGEWPDPDSVMVLKRRLLHDRCQGMLFGPAYLPSCLRALKGSDSAARLTAATLICGIGHRATVAIPDLIKAFADPEPAVASRSMNALCAIGLAAEADLRKATQDPNPVVRRCAAETIASLWPSASDSIADLKKALNDPVPAKQRTAANAIEVLAAEPRAENLTQTGKENEPVECLRPNLKSIAGFGSTADHDALIKLALQNGGLDTFQRWWNTTTNQWATGWWWSSYYVPVPPAIPDIW